MLKNRLTNCLRIILLIFILSLTSCSTVDQNKNMVTNPTEMDKSWLTGEPCKAPCWYGIIPGISSKNDVLEKIKPLTFINPQKTGMRQGSSWDGKPEEYIDLYGVNPPERTYIITLKQDKVDTIRIYPNYQISMDEAVKRIGEPDFIHTNPTDETARACILDVYWRKQQLLIGYQEEEHFFGGFDLCTFVNKHDGKIPQNLIVDGILYDSKESMDEYIKRITVRPWKGFITEK
jgi:hypothetical protein